MFHLPWIHTIIQLKAFQLEEFLVLYQLKFSFNTSKNMTLSRISVGPLKKSLVPLLIISFLMINNLVCILGNDEVDCRRMADVSGAVYLSSSVQRYSAGDYRSSTCSGSYMSCGVYQSVWQAIPRSHFSDSFTAPPPTRAARGAFLPWTFSAALGARVPAVDPKGMSSSQGCLWGCRRVVCCQQQCKVLGNSRLHLFIYRSCDCT